MAFAVAVVVHGVVLWRIGESSVRPRIVAERLPITVAVVTPMPPVAPPLPVIDELPVAPPTPATPTPAAPTPATPAPSAPPTTSSSAPTSATPATSPVPTAPPTTDAPANDVESVMRLPRSSGGIESILGVGGALGPSQAALTGSLDLQVDGAVSDTERAIRKATRALQDDLADDAVSAGLADDWFRELNQHLTAAWQPAVKELNDGGAATTQLGMMKGAVQDTAAWGEMWNAYMDLAKQYANGVQPRLESLRVERLRELMRSRKGAFRMHAIAEVRLTVDKTGTIQLLEFTSPSGHPGIDDGISNAIARALLAMPAPPPERLHNGRSFTSSWRLRATWSMVPPTAFFMGSSFDITPKGFTADVPFQIKLNTNVLLQRTSARPSP